MVLPIYKLISFAIKVISKPMANYSKQYHIEKNKIQTANWLSYIFKNLGYLDYRFQNWVDRKIMKIRTSYKEEKVNEEVAIQKGVQLFYQIILYTLGISLTIYQINMSSLQGQQKAQKLDNKVSTILERTKKNNEQLQQLNLDKGRQTKPSKVIDHRIPSCNQQLKLLFINKQTHLYSLC